MDKTSVIRNTPKGVKLSMTETENIDQYISQFPEDIQIILQKIRNLIHETSPELVESISYAIPTFKLNGKNLIHFADFKNHIGFYPTPSGAEKFKNKLKLYKQGKGSV